MKSSKILETIQDPWTGVKKWFADAQKCGLNNYNAVTLSTSDGKGKVSSRVVLVKKISEKEGFFFYTNLQSHKGKQLKKNPYVSMLAYWDKLNRQIRIEGKCSFLSQKQTEIYFFTRDKESQIGAWASKQSKELKTREELLENYSPIGKKLKQKLKFLVKIDSGILRNFKFECSKKSFASGTKSRIRNSIFIEKISLLLLFF